ncbi:MAG: TetR/AcrR family transcriptional regulator, partial [Gemmatimonadales bacterium]
MIPSPRFHRRPADRPDELLEAALTVFGERGFAHATLEEVAARAGVSKGTVYLYFASKDDLLRAIIEKKVVTLLEGVESLSREHTGTATALLTAVIHRLWDLMARPDIMRVCRLVQAELVEFPEIRRFFFEHVIQRHRRALRAIAARGVASGEFRRHAVVVVPRMVPSLVMQLNQTRFIFGDLDAAAPAPARMRDAVVNLLVDGIGTGKPPRGRPVKTRKRMTASRIRHAGLSAVLLAGVAGSMSAQSNDQQAPVPMTIGAALA